MIKDITGIIYGGQITTFLLYKEDILRIMLDDKNTKEHPFFAWECVSI